MDGFMVHCCKCDSGFEIDPDNVTCPKCTVKARGTQPKDVGEITKLVKKEMIEAGEQMASDLMDAKITKSMGNLGGHVIKKVEEYNNSDLIQKYLDYEISSVELIYVAMERARKQN